MGSSSQNKNLPVLETGGRENGNIVSTAVCFARRDGTGKKAPAIISLGPRDITYYIQRAKF